MQNYSHAMRSNMSNMNPTPPLPPQARPAWTPAPAGRPPVRRGSRRLLPLLLLLCALIIAAASAAADLYRDQTTLAIQVPGQQALQLDLNQGFAASPYLLGSNVFPRAGTSAQDQGGRGFMSYDQRVINGLRSANIKLLRFPGGNWGEEHTLSTAQLNDFSTLLNQVGAEGIMQAQLSDPLDVTPVPLRTRASRAALLVDYMNNPESIQRQGTKAPFHRIKYWTIGNEPDLLINPDTGQRYTVDAYTQAFIAYSLAMHEKDPGIKIFGPEISRYQGQQGPRDAAGKLWMDSFLTQIAQYERTHALPFHLLDGVSFHWYPFDNAQKNFVDLLNEPAALNSLLPALRQTIRQQFGEDLPIAITEINTSPGKVVPAPDLAALWWAETLGTLMNNHVEYVAFFSTEGVDTPFPLFIQQDLRETAMLRTMQLFARLQRYVVPLPATQGPVSVYAAEDQQHNTVSILFINKSDVSQQVSAGNSGLLPLGPWKGATLTLGGHGMSVVILHRNGSDEAFSFNNIENTQQSAPAVQHLICSTNVADAFTC